MLRSSGGSLGESILEAFMAPEYPRCLSIASHNLRTDKTAQTWPLNFHPSLLHLVLAHRCGDPTRTGTSWWNLRSRGLVFATSHHMHNAVPIEVRR